MPIGVKSKDLHSTQDSVGILLSRDISDSHRIGEEERRRSNFFGEGNDDVGGALHLASEKFIRLGKVCPDLDRGVIRAKFAEDNIERNGFRALLRELVHDSAVNLARPIETKAEAERTIPNCPDAIFVDIDEPEIRRDMRRKLQRLTRADVVGDAFKPFEKLEAKQSQKTNQNNDSQGDQTGDEFERL